MHVLTSRCTVMCDGCTRLCQFFCGAVSVNSSSMLTWQAPWGWDVLLAWTSFRQGSAASLEPGCLHPPLLLLLLANQGTFTEMFAVILAVRAEIDAKTIISTLVSSIQVLVWNYVKHESTGQVAQWFGILRSWVRTKNTIIRRGYFHHTFQVPDIFCGCSKRQMQMRFQLSLNLKMSKLMWVIKSVLAIYSVGASVVSKGQYLVSLCCWQRNKNKIYLNWL